MQPLSCLSSGRDWADKDSTFLAMAMPVCGHAFGQVGTRPPYRKKLALPKRCMKATGMSVANCSATDEDLSRLSAANLFRRKEGYDVCLSG
jgi:hypothetical protein